MGPTTKRNPPARPQKTKVTNTLPSQMSCSTGSCAIKSWNVSDENKSSNALFECFKRSMERVSGVCFLRCCFWNELLPRATLTGLHWRQKKHGVVWIWGCAWQSERVLSCAVQAWRRGGCFTLRGQSAQSVGARNGARYGARKACPKTSGHVLEEIVVTPKISFSLKINKGKISGRAWWAP